MACATAPPFASLDIDAWERSLDVNVRGFLYCLAAVLPAMRERGGGRVVVAGVEDTGGTPDPLLRAWRAAVRTILEELLTARPQVHVSGPITKLRSIWFNAALEMPVSYGAREAVSQ